MSLEHLETKGDVSFYRGASGETYQFVQLGMERLGIPSTLGLTQENRYLLIETFKGYDIKYDGLGEEGFSIWKEEVKISQLFWGINDATNYVLDELEFPCCDCGRMVSFEGVNDTYSYFHCEVCDEFFCYYCIEEIETDDVIGKCVCHSCLSKK